MIVKVEDLILWSFTSLLRWVRTLCDSERKTLDICVTFSTLFIALLRLDRLRQFLTLSRHSQYPALDNQSII